MALNPATSDILQSIRSSCERCRCFKLKCVVTAKANGPSKSDNTVPCQRCTRAKAPCVFGRRRRANRLSDMKKRNPQPISDSVSPTAPEVENPTVVEPNFMPNCEMQLECESEAAQCDFQTWESESLALDLPSNVPSEQDSMSDWDWNWEELQHGFNLDDACIMNTDDISEAIPTSWSSSPVLPLPLLSQPTEGAILISNRRRGNTEMNSSEPGLRLIALIADMQQCLKMLEEGPWQYDSACGLDDYPVGHVVHLSQQFGALAGPVLSKSCASGVASECDTNGEGKAQATSYECNDGDGETTGLRRPGVDTVTTLLVLGGYVLLVRIYSIVMGHFQTHLSRIPSGSSCIFDHSGAANRANMNPTLQLGELPSAAPVLGRIHTAVCMLLAALHGVESRLGQKGTIARTLAQEDVLGADELQDNYGGLSKKIFSVKKVLKEKIFQ